MRLPDRQTMRLPDRQKSRAVLLGTSTYKSLPNIPSVRNNLVAMQECLCDENIWGLAANNCTVVSDPASSEEFLSPIDEAADSVSDTLLIYFSGHGLVDPDSGLLWLTITGSKAGKSHTSVKYDEVKRMLINSSARSKIVVLDCCFSGRAIGGMSGSASTAIDQTPTEGAFVLASAPENREALAPPGQHFTAFTGELIQLIRTGIPGGKETLAPDDIYVWLLSRLKARALPEPQRRASNVTGTQPLVRNVAFVPTRCSISTKQAEAVKRSVEHHETYRVLFAEKVNARQGRRFPRSVNGYSPRAVDDVIDEASQRASELLDLVDPHVGRGGSPSDPTLEYPEQQGRILGGSLVTYRPARSVPVDSFKTPEVRSKFPQSQFGYERSSVETWQELCAIFVKQIWATDEWIRRGT